MPPSMVRSPAKAVYMGAHASIPIVPQIEAHLPTADRDRLTALAERLLRNEPALGATDVFGPGVSCGLTDAPAVVYEDHREISLFDATDDTPLEYRSLLLAGDGDMVVVGGRPYPAFESYCRDKLGLGAPDVLHVGESFARRGVPLADRCLGNPQLIEHLYDACRRNGELNIVPYIGKGTSWKLARTIAARTARPVCVAAPPPRLTRRVNDKIWFAERVREVLNRDALPPSYSVFGPAALAGRIAALARRFPQVVVKVPDSAGSLGNVVVRSADIARWPLASLRNWILDSLRERGWRDVYPLLVGVWDETVLCSPSVNLWLPDPAEGPPVIEGIFMQTLRGAEGEFVGAEPSDLPEGLDRRLADEALTLGFLLQRLGYFGRCGFDAVLFGPSIEDADVHWIECNGRWGGVSTPVTLANRLAGNWRGKGLVIVQQSRVRLPPRDFESTLNLLGDMLLTGPHATEGVVLVAPARFVSGSGVNFMVLGRDGEHARRGAEAALARLLRREAQVP